MPFLTIPSGRFCYFHISGIAPPTIAFVSAGFSDIYSVAALPYINFTNTGATSYTWSLFESSTSNGRTEEIDTGSGGTPTGNITSTHATVLNYWYYFTVTVTNSAGSASYSNSRIQNYIAAPTVTVTTFNFSGTVPSTQAQPYFTFTSTDVISYAWGLFEKALYEDDPTQIASGIGGVPTNPQTITYFGATVVDYYYSFTITVTNNAGSDTYSTAYIQNYALQG
jgi:hypothetical protein